MWGLRAPLRRSTAPARAKTEGGNGRLLKIALVRRNEAGQPCTPGHHGRPWTQLVALSCHPLDDRTLPGERAGDAEADVVVPVRGFVPVAVGRAEVLRIVVPTAGLRPAAL